LISRIPLADSVGDACSDVGEAIKYVGQALNYYARQNKAAQVRVATRHQRDATNRARELGRAPVPVTAGSTRRAAPSDADNTALG
jgi:hypothetical protein